MNIIIAGARWKCASACALLCLAACRGFSWRCWCACLRIVVIGVSSYCPIAHDGSLKGADVEVLV